MENTTKRIENALTLFDSGLNCAQSVVASYAEEFGADKKLLLQTACGFGAGMGRLQETCGAATGAFMAIGIATCKTESDNLKRKEMSYASIQTFKKKFIEMNNAIDCRTLLGVDLLSEEGRQAMAAGVLHATVCKKCISDAIKITDELIG